MHYLLYTDGAYFPEHERSAIAYVMLQSTPKKEVRRMKQTVKGDKIVAERGIVVSFSWVKSHSGNFYNELCDVLCTQAMDEYASQNKV